jgi:hypothetical protein
MIRIAHNPKFQIKSYNPEGQAPRSQKARLRSQAASPRQQKIILKRKLMNLRPFQKLVDLIKQSKNGYVTKKELLEYESPSPSCSGSDGDDNNHNYSYDFANNFDMIIGWRRTALLIDYNSDNETIKLRDEDVVDH